MEEILVFISVVILAMLLTIWRVRRVKCGKHRISRIPLGLSYQYMPMFPCYAETVSHYDLADPSVWLVQDSCGHPEGIVLYTDVSGVLCIYAMEVIRCRQGSGIGTAIMRNLMSYGRMSGMDGLVVRAVNGTDGFYRACGMREIEYNGIVYFAKDLCGTPDWLRIVTSL